MLPEAGGVALAIKDNLHFLVTRVETNVDGSTYFLTSEFNLSGQQLRTIRQSPWPKEWGTPDSVAVDGNGNVAAARTHYDLVIAKCDATGRRLWFVSDISFGMGFDQAKVELDAQGNVFLGAVARGGGTPSLPYPTLIKYGLVGERLWTFKLSSPASEGRTELHVDEHGAVAFSRRGTRIFKLSADGRLLWQTRLFYGGGATVAGPDSLLVLHSSMFSFQTPPAIVMTSSNQRALPGTNVVLSAIATGTPPLLYQWWRNGEPIPGATNAAMTIQNFQADSTGEYVVQTQNTLGSVFSPRINVELETRSLLAPAISPDRYFEFVLHAPPGAYRIETSTDFSVWTPATTVSQNAQLSTIRLPLEPASVARFFRVRNH